METISGKVTPKIPTPQFNNYITESAVKASNQYKYVVYSEAFLGINRLYLLNVPKTVTYLSRIYSALLVVITIYFVVLRDSINTASYIVFKFTAAAEFILLIGNSIILFQARGQNFCQKLNEVDISLNIEAEMAINDLSLKKNFIWVAFNLVYNVIEATVFKFYIDDFMTGTTMFLYVPLLAHECEHIFLCSLLRSIYLRVQVVRAHVDKVLGCAEKDKKGDLSGLVYNASLDVSALHRVYENLHRCAENLNMIMNIPTVIMLISSGVSTTFMLKSFINLAQSVDAKNTVPVLYFGVRCIKYTLLVFAPCIYSSMTSGYVKAIRTALYDAINNAELGSTYDGTPDVKLGCDCNCTSNTANSSYVHYAGLCFQADPESRLNHVLHGRVDRRKLKAFLQLTRDSDFVYSLFGVIAIDMALPLSYFSICTTYLVIIIQFSKFID